MVALPKLDWCLDFTEMPSFLRRCLGAGFHFGGGYGERGNTLDVGAKRGCHRWEKESGKMEEGLCGRYVSVFEVLQDRLLA